MGEKLVFQVVLQNTKLGHHKFYELSINYVQDLAEPYRLAACWGRIEQFETGSPQSQTKGWFMDLEGAKYFLRTIQFEKQKKGYELMCENQWTKSGSKRKNKQKKTTGPDEHFGMSVVTPWWKLKSVDRVV